MSVPWEFFSSSHFISQLSPTRFPLITAIRMCHLLPVHHQTLSLLIVLQLLSCRFVIAAVSPAVVVPCLLHLQDLGYGVDKGIPTLVIAAASIDDVLAITGFGVVLGIAFAEGMYTHTHTRVSQKVMLFFFCTGIITDTGTYIIHQNEAGPLWIMKASYE